MRYEVDILKDGLVRITLSGVSESDAIDLAGTLTEYGLTVRLTARPRE